MINCGTATGRDSPSHARVASRAAVGCVFGRVSAVGGGCGRCRVWWVASGPAQERGCVIVALLIGYARCSTDEQDLTAQRDGLPTVGVAAARVYVDRGLTGTNPDRPGLREALAACREGDTLVVTKLDRLARSLPDAGGSPMSSPPDRSG